MAEIDTSAPEQAPAEQCGAAEEQVELFDAGTKLGARPHRWIGWPGAFCLDCGLDDPTEIAFADGDYEVVEDPSAPEGFRYEFPNLVVPPCPGPKIEGDR